MNFYKKIGLVVRFFTCSAYIYIMPRTFLIIFDFPNEPEAKYVWRKTEIRFVIWDEFCDRIICGIELFLNYFEAKDVALCWLVYLYCVRSDIETEGKERERNCVWKRYASMSRTNEGVEFESNTNSWVMRWEIFVRVCMNITLSVVFRWRIVLEKKTTTTNYSRKSWLLNICWQCLVWIVCFPESIDSTSNAI